jgi:DNA-binding NarL/FixJ family response regulator
VKAFSRAYTEVVMNLKKLRILLADDDPALCSALALLLETRLNAGVVGQSSSMEYVLHDIRRLQPDIIILDSELPGLPRRDRIATLHRMFPALKVIVIGTQPETAQPPLALHADAYISKSEPPEQMVQMLLTI